MTHRKLAAMWMVLGSALAGIASAETVPRAFANLYQVAKEITDNPRNGYEPDQQPDWPYASDIQKQWRNSVGANGTQITPEDRRLLVPCAAHLNTAIDAMQRGYRIERTQKQNPPADPSIQALYTRGRSQFGMCAAAYAYAMKNLGSAPPSQTLSAGVAKNQLPEGAVDTPVPDSPDYGTPGYLGSFPGTKSTCGSFCYSYLWEQGIYNVNPGPVQNPLATGHAAPQTGDVAVVYQRFANTSVYQPLHFAIYQGNGMFYQRNGVSNIEIVNADFFRNFQNAIVRYFTPATGR